MVNCLEIVGLATAFSIVVALLKRMIARQCWLGRLKRFQLSGGSAGWIVSKGKGLVDSHGSGKGIICFRRN
ncbi:hypothetical protein V6N12_046915 [Hibiscus sabdariffa]|uniref:Uncharacterized protein n=1 Tax=Hibiscus sabdariffa TaxID=183260 RepID=A0ABR2BC26_9ROSI